MKSYLHDHVRRLLELHALEDRVATLRRDSREKANAEALIKSLRSDLPPSVLTVHDQRRSKSKRSVAEVRHGVCAGCHLALGVGNVAALRRGELRRCGNCGRYVYLVDEEEEEAVPKSKPPKKAGGRGASRVPCCGSC